MRKICFFLFLALIITHSLISMRVAPDFELDHVAIEVGFADSSIMEYHHLFTYAELEKYARRLQEKRDEKRREQCSVAGILLFTYGSASALLAAVLALTGDVETPGQWVLASGIMALPLCGCALSCYAKYKKILRPRRYVDDLLAEKKASREVLSLSNCCKRYIAAHKKECDKQVKTMKFENLLPDMRSAINQIEVRRNRLKVAVYF